MSIFSSIKSIFSKSSPTSSPQSTTQYSGPIGPNPQQSSIQNGNIVSPRPSTSGTAQGTRVILNGGGGGYPTPSGSTPQQTITKTPTPEQQEQGKSVTTANNQIAVNYVGQNVRIGNQSYSGQTYVPELKMTASEYQKKIEAQAVSKGKVKPQDLRRTSYNVTTQQTQKEEPYVDTINNLPTQSIAPSTLNQDVDSLFYFSIPGGFNSSPRYFQTYNNGTVIKEFTSEEVKNLGLTTTNVLQASEKKPLYQKISNLVTQNQPYQSATKYLSNALGKIAPVIDYSFGESGKKYVGIGGSIVPPIIPTIEDITIKKSLGLKPGQAYVSTQEIQSVISKNAGKISRIVSSSPSNFFNPSQNKVAHNELLIQTGTVLIPTTPGQVAIYGGTAFLATAPQIVRIPIESYFGFKSTIQTLNPATPLPERIVSGLVVAGSGSGLIYETGIPRRLQLYSQVRDYASQLPEKQRVEFYTKFEEAKSYLGVKPEIKQIDLSRLDFLKNNVKAQTAIKNYLQNNPDLIVGGSVAQQPQFEKGVGSTKRPGDIDIYVKKLFTNEKKVAAVHAVDIAKILRENNVPAYAKSGKIVGASGEKFIEFHPYKTYLRPNIEQVTPIIYPPRFGLTKTPEGIKILSLDIQAPRKVVGYYLEPVISGKTRSKDLPAYETIKKSLEKTYKKSQSAIPFSFSNIELTSSVDLKAITLNTKESNVLLPVTLKDTGVGGREGRYPTVEFSYPKFVESIYDPFKTEIIPSYQKVSESYIRTPKKTNGSYASVPKKNVAAINSNYIPFVTKSTTTPNVITKTSYKPFVKPQPFVPYIPYSNKTIIPKQKQEKYYYMKAGFQRASVPLGLFNVFVRRQGKFKPVGTRLSLNDALRTGTEVTQKGLGQTFKIEKVFDGAVNFETPKGYYKKYDKNGILFIEQPKTKINTESEKALLKLSRTLKGGRKRKRK